VVIKLPPNRLQLLPKKRKSSKAAAMGKNGNFAAAVHHPKAYPQTIVFIDFIASIADGFMVYCIFISLIEFNFSRELK